HYKYTKVYEAAEGESVDSKPAINFQRDVVFYSKAANGVESILIKPRNSDGTYGNAITVATNNPNDPDPERNGLSFDFFANGLALEDAELAKKLMPNESITELTGRSEPVITDRIGDEVYVVYYEGGAANPNQPAIPENCGVPSYDISTLMRFNLYRARVNLANQQVTKTLILGTGKSYCSNLSAGPRFDVMAIQAPFSINSSGQVAISAFVFSSEALEPRRHILVSSPSDSNGVTGIPKPRIVAERHTTVDQGGLVFHSSLGSPQINDAGDIALLATSYDPEIEPIEYRKFLYFIPSNTSTLRRLVEQSDGGGVNQYSQLSGRPSLNNNKQVAIFVSKLEGDFLNPGILIANASCGRSGQDNCPQGEGDFDWITGLEGSTGNSTSKYKGEFLDFTHDILLFDKAIKKNGAPNEAKFPYMQGFSMGVRSYVEKDNNSGEPGGQIIKDSIFSSNFYNPDGGIILREGSELGDRLVESLNYGRYSANKNGTLAITVRLNNGSERIYEIRPCEADGACLDFGQSTFGPDADGDGVADLLRGRTVIGKLRITSKDNGLAMPLSEVTPPITIDGSAFTPTTNATDFSDSFYYEINSFLPISSQIDYSFTANIEGTVHSQNGKIDVWTPKDANYNFVYVPLNCPVFPESASYCDNQEVLFPDAFRQRGVASFRQMFPVRPNDVTSLLITERKDSSVLAGSEGVYKDIKEVWVQGKYARNNGYSSRAGIGILPKGYFKQRFRNSKIDILGKTILPSVDTPDNKHLRFASLVEEHCFHCVPHELVHLFTGKFQSKVHIGRATVDGYNFIPSIVRETGPVWRNQEIFQASIPLTYQYWVGNHSWVDTMNVLNNKYIPVQKENIETTLTENIIFSFIKKGSTVQFVKGLRKNSEEEVYEGESNLRAIVRNAKGEITRNIPLPTEFEEEDYLDNEGEVEVKKTIVSDGPMVLSVPVSIYDASYSIELNGSPIFSENINLHVLDTMIDYIPVDGFRADPDSSRTELKSVLASAMKKAINSDYSGASLDLNNTFKKSVNRLLVNSPKRKLEDSSGIQFYLEDILTEISTATQRLAISASEVSQPVRLFEITSNKNIYSSGERAIIKSKEIVSLEDKEYEYALVAKVDGSSQRVDRFNDVLFKSETSPLTVGVHNYSIEVFKQNKRFAKNIEEALNAVSKELVFIEKELEKETDEDKRLKLENRKQIVLKREVFLKEKLFSHRKNLGLTYNYEIFVE
ncbi:MAG: hypothetical protein M9962_13915, partial [Oligoflexia bacterium]|nr:hypothetical protein [Oligoflexia bacterium]